MNKIVWICLISLLMTIDVVAQNRIDVPASRTTIILPEGTHYSPHYAAFTRGEEFEISVMELGEGSADQLHRIDSAMYRDSMGFDVYKQFEMDVDGYPGKVLLVHSDPNVDVIQLLFGDSTFYVMVNGRFERGNDILYEELLASYKTIEMNASRSIDWDNFLAIDYDKSNAFKLQENFVNQILLFKTAADTVNESFIMVQQLPNDGYFASEEIMLAEFLGNTIFNTYQIETVVSEGKRDIEGKSAYEFAVTGRNTYGDVHHISSMIRMKDDLIFVIVAVGRSSVDQLEVERFLNSIRFKV